MLIFYTDFIISIIFLVSNLYNHIFFSVLLFLEYMFCIFSSDLRALWFNNIV